MHYKSNSCFILSARWFGQGLMNKSLPLYFAINFMQSYQLGTSSEDKDIIHHSGWGSSKKHSITSYHILEKSSLKCHVSTGVLKANKLHREIVTTMSFGGHYSKGLACYDLYLASLNFLFSLHCLKMRPFNFPPFLDRKEGQHFK